MNGRYALLRLWLAFVAMASCASIAQANAEQPQAARVAAGERFIVLPKHIPATCVNNAAERYAVPAVALLAIMKTESGGRTGVINKNKNGSVDYGPAQLNSRSWGRVMQERYGISAAALTNNMCQALMAQAYALRSEWDRCRKKGNGSIWCAIAYYHSPTPKYQRIYVANVWKKYQSMIARGRF